MADQIASLVLKIDSTSAKGASADLEKLNQAGKTVETSLAAVGTSGKEAATGVSSVSDAAKSAQNQVNTLNTTFSQTATALRNIPASMNSVSSSLTGSSAPLGILAKQGQELRDSLSQLGPVARAAMSQLSALNGIATTSRAAETSVKSVGVAAKDAATGTDALSKAAKAADADVASVAKSSGLAATAMNELSRAANGYGAVGRAASSALGGMSVGIGAVAVAVAALGYAYYQGSQETVRFNKALILTGNYAGVSADGLADMAKRIGDVSGTTGKAADALTKIVSTGRITSRSIEEVGLAAVAMEKATGQSVDQTIENFTKLAEAPTAASAKLNEQYHYLTASVYEQIKALEVQGRKQDAAALAQSTFSTATQQMGVAVKNNAGIMERSWDGVTSAVKRAVDAMKSIGRVSTQSEEIASLEQQIADRERKLSMGNVGGINKQRTEMNLAADKAKLAALRDQVQIQKNIATAGGLAAQAEEAAIAQSQTRDAYLKARKGTSMAASLEEENKDFQKAVVGLKAGTDEYEKVLTAHNDKVAQIKKQFSGGATVDDAATKLIQQLREQEAAMRLQLGVSEKLTDAEKERAKYVQLYADLKEKKVLTAEQKSLLAKESEVRAQLDSNVAVSEQLRLKTDMIKLDERALEIQRNMAASAESRGQQYEDQLGAMGLGRQAQERVKAQQDLRKESQRNQRTLSRGLSEGALNSDEFAKQSQMISTGLADALEQQRDYYAEVDRLQSDWKVGATSGLADYADMTKNVAQQAGSAFANAFQGAEDALANFVTTGKLSFSEMANSIISDLARIAIRQNITGVLASGLSAAIGGMFGGGSNAAVGSTSGMSGSWGAVAGGRAFGGDTRAGGLYEVNERGPELYTERGKTYLMSGDGGGYVSPATTSGGQSAPNVEINLINQSGQELTASKGGMSMDSIRGMVLDVIVSDARKNGRGIQAVKGAM